MKTEERKLLLDSVFRMRAMMVSMNTQLNMVTMLLGGVVPSDELLQLMGDNCLFGEKSLFMQYLSPNVLPGATGFI